MCSHRVALRFHIQFLENVFVFGVANSVGSLGCFFFVFFLAVKLVYTSDKVSGKYNGLKRTTLCLVVFLILLQQEWLEWAGSWMLDSVDVLSCSSKCAM